MRLVTPDTLESVLFDGELFFEEVSAQRALGEEVTREQLQQWERARVTIGKPRCWPITDFFDLGTLPHAVASLFQHSNFYVLRLACSFNSGRSTHVEWARFSVKLAPNDSTLPPPVAFDIHPQQEFEERKRNYKIELTPSLKFKDHVEVSAGKAGLELEYKELIPVVTGFGAEQNHFHWDLEKTPQHPLVGIRWFHAIVEKPKIVKHIRASFDIVADVVTPRGLWRAAHNQADMQMEYVICE